jgi:hypothetical protein
VKKNKFLIIGGPGEKSITPQPFNEEEHARAVARNAEVEKPVVNDLRSIGYVIDSLDQLRQSSMRYRTAIPVLLKWLLRISAADVKESIVRTLSVPWARPEAIQPLIDEFRAAPLEDDGLKWAIGNALWVIGDDSVFDQLVELIRDRRHGTARQMIVMGMEKMKNPMAVDVLLEVLPDDQVTGHAIIALGKLRARRARSAIEPYCNSSRAWIRQEAKKALERINRRR